MCAIAYKLPCVLACPSINILVERTWFMHFLNMERVFDGECLSLVAYFAVATGANIRAKGPRAERSGTGRLAQVPRARPDEFYKNGCQEKSSSSIGGREDFCLEIQPTSL